MTVLGVNNRNNHTSQEFLPSIPRGRRKGAPGEIREQLSDNWARSGQSVRREPSDPSPLVIRWPFQWWSSAPATIQKLSLVT